MKAPAFWWEERPTWQARALAPLGSLYGGIVARRMVRAGDRAALPVICVGNIVAGGAGKTPTVAALRSLLIAQGERPFVLSRGYGGRLSGPVLVDPSRHGASDVGDEPLMLVQGGPVVVARDRRAGAEAARNEGASLIIMDDGLQNPSLVKDLTLAVVDAASGIGNGLPIPAGPLRAPLDRQWPSIDALIVIGDGDRAQPLVREARLRVLPVFRGRLTMSLLMQERLRGRRVLAFCGIGRPSKFADTLRGVGAHISGLRAFADHHPFSEGELAALAAQAAQADATLVTTEKDAARLPQAFVTEMADRLIVVPVSLVLDDDAGLLALIDDRLAKSRARP